MSGRPRTDKKLLMFSYNNYKNFIIFLTRESSFSVILDWFSISNKCSQIFKIVESTVEKNVEYVLLYK